MIIILKWQFVSHGVRKDKAVHCKICNTIEYNNVYEVEEMMLGFRDKFTYFQCSHCKCLQIAEIPVDMPKYYPSNYYSFSADPLKKYRNKIKTHVVRFRDHYSVLNGGLLTSFVNLIHPNNPYRILSHANLTINSSVLDVGCGSGWYLYGLREAGFKNVTGIDPYLQNDISYTNGLSIFKKTIFDMRETWDLIMYNHSFEHVDDQRENLNKVSNLLAEGGICLIRIPTVSSYAWEHYKEHWVSLDAPRHYFLHSIESMELLASQAGLQVKKILYESTELQFIGSELYLRNIPLNSAHADSFFSKSMKKKWKTEARKLNKEKQGDHAAFILGKR